MQHADLSRCTRSFVRANGKERQRGGAFADENWNAVPHSFVQSLETQDVDVPLRRTFNIPHAQRHVINSFNVNHADSFALIELSRTLISDND
jgi:hypothetical protein